MAIESLDEAKATARLIQSGQIAGPARDKAMAALREFDTRQRAPKLGDEVPKVGPAADAEFAAKEAAYKAMPKTPVADFFGDLGEKVSAPLAPLKAAVLGTPEFLMQGASSVGAGLKGLAVGGGQAILNQIPGAPHENAMEAANRAIEGSTYSPQLKPSQDLAEGVGRINEGLGKDVGTLARKAGVPEPIANEIEMQLPNAINTGLALAGGPKAAVERPALTIKHVADETGHHTTISPNGETLSTETAFGRLRATRDDTAASARGQGEATARIEKMIKEAEARGLIPESDISLSPAEANIWRTKLVERGYKIKENPNEPSVNGILSKDSKKGVFEVEPPPAAKPRGQMSPTEMHAADVKLLDEENVPVRLDQRGTSLPRKIVGGLKRGADAALGESPTKATQKQAMNAAILRTDPFLKVEATNASPDVLGGLAREHSREYGTVLESSPTKVNASGLDTKLKDFSDTLSRTMSPAEQAPFIAQIDNIKSKYQPTAESLAARDAEIARRAAKPAEAPQGIDGRTGLPWPKPKAQPEGPLPELEYQIPGKATHAIRTEINQRLAGNRDPNVAHAADELIDLLDNAFEESATPEMAARMDRVRGAVHRRKQIEDAVKGSETHDISPSKLLTALQKNRNRNQSLHGNTPDPMDAKLNRLAQAGKNVLKDTEGNSGTPARGLAIASLGILGESAALGHPLAGLGTVASVYSLAKGARTLSELGMKPKLKMVPAKPSRNQLTAKAIRGAVASNVSPEERKRRLQAEALRNAQ